MSYEIVSLPALTMVGRKIRTTNKNWKCMTDIDNLWKELQAKKTFSHIPFPVSPYTIVSVYTDYDPDFNVQEDEYSVIIGGLVTHTTLTSDKLVVKKIPAAKYAMFTAQGPFDTAIGAAWQEIWSSDIERAFTNDFEWYDTHSTNDEKSIVKIYIAIK